MNKSEKLEKLEEWKRMIRNLKDTSENPYETQTFLYKVFFDLSTKKIKEKHKFKERTGKEFLMWTESLDFSDSTKQLLNDDDLWLLTLDLTRF